MSSAQVYANAEADFGEFYGAGGSQSVILSPDQQPDDACVYNIVGKSLISTSVGTLQMPSGFSGSGLPQITLRFSSNNVDGSFSGNFQSTYVSSCDANDYYYLSVDYSGDSMIPIATASPKYQVLSILYDPPGNASSNGFSNTQSAGATTSIQKTFTQGVNLTFNLGFLGADGNITFSTHSTQGDTKSFTTSYQASNSSQLPSTKQKIDHTQDQIYLLIDPTIKVTQTGYAAGYYQIQPSVDATGQFTNGVPPDILNVNIAGLNNPSLIPLAILEPQVRQLGTTLPGLSFICAHPLPKAQCTSQNACGCTSADFASITPQDELRTDTNDSTQPSTIDPVRYVFITSLALEGPQQQGGGDVQNAYTVSDSNISGYSTSNGKDYGVTLQHGWHLPLPDFTLGFESESSLTYSQTQTVGTSYGTAHEASITLGTSDVGCYEYVDVYEDTTYHTFALALSEPAPPECQ